MKHYVEYFNMDNKGRYSRPLGDRSIITLDNRLSLPSMRETAQNNNGVNRPKYHAYQILAGQNLYDAKAITKLCPLTA